MNSVLPHAQEKLEECADWIGLPQDGGNRAEAFVAAVNGLLAQIDLTPQPGRSGRDCGNGGAVSRRGYRPFGYRPRIQRAGRYRTYLQSRLGWLTFSSAGSTGLGEPLSSNKDSLMKAVILAAGKGTRIHTITDGGPKSLLPLGDSTLIGQSLKVFADQA